MTIANPQLFLRDRAPNVDPRHEGFIMVDLRTAARQLDVRVAATPSYYPSVIAFPPGTAPGTQNPRVIPPIGVLGFHSFS